MSHFYIKIPTVLCDYCDVSSEEGDPGATLAQLRKHLRGDGWRFDGKLAECPKCRAQEPSA